MSDYSGYDIKQLWQMVDAARQGLQPSHDQVAALNKAQQMLSGHAQSLEKARDQLATKWPPEANAASAAYLHELDRLITAVRDTALSCAVNVFHINTVSDAIVQAHDTLAPLHDEFVKNERALAQYDAEINAFGDGASAIPGSNTIARGTAELFTSPRVEDGRQDDLVRRAQQAMEPLAGAAKDGASYIKPPTPYAAPIVGSPIDNNPTEQSEGSVSPSRNGAIPPPDVDPPAYTRTQIDHKTTTQSGGGTAQPSTSDSGPELSGYSPTPIESTSSLTPPIKATRPIAFESPVGSHSSLMPELATPTSRYGGRLPNGLPPNEVAVDRGPFSKNGTVRNSVIGDPPVGRGSVVSTPSRVNTPAGVIGQQPGPAGKGPAGSRTAGGNGATALGQQANRRRRGSRAVGETRWNRDNPWEIEDGVDPVIMPALAPGRVDPGPGIIGIDR